jgi:hypothetical protein
VGLTTLTCKKKIVEKPPRNSAGFCGGGQGLSWAVEPRKEEEKNLTNTENLISRCFIMSKSTLVIPNNFISIWRKYKCELKFKMILSYFQASEEDKLVTVQRSMTTRYSLHTDKFNTNWNS